MWHRWPTCNALCRNNPNCCFLGNMVSLFVWGFFLRVCPHSQNIVICSSVITYLVWFIICSCRPYGLLLSSKLESRSWIKIWVTWFLKSPFRGFNSALNLHLLHLDTTTFPPSFKRKKMFSRFSLNLQGFHQAVQRMCARATWRKPS